MSDRPENSRRRRRQWIAAIPILLGLVFVFRPKIHQHRFDDSDLALPPPRVVPAISNAMAILDQASEHHSVDVVQLRSLREESASTQPLSPEALSFLAEAVDFQAVLRRALEAPEVVLTRTNDPPPSASDERPWEALLTYAALRLRSDFENGEATRALRWALQLAALSHRLESAGGTHLDFIYAGRFRDHAIRQIQAHADRLAPQDPELLEALARLPSLSLHRPGLSNVVRTEYARSLALYAALKRGKVPGATNSLPIPLPNLVLDLEKSRRREAGTARFMLAHIGTPLTAVPFADLASAHSPTSVLRALIRGNAIGSAMADMQSSSTLGLLKSAAATDCRVHLTVVLLALRAHESKGTGLPRSLAELVPEYLPREPLDAHDGHPLRYDRDRRLLWCIGRDLVDDQGRTRQPKKPDATFDTVVAITW